MSQGQIRVNTAQVGQIATSLEALNRRLDTELRESQTIIRRLLTHWDSPASQATISAYDSFAAKYFQNYYDIINQYVVFLRTNVDAGYFETEGANVNISEAFK